MDEPDPKVVLAARGGDLAAFEILVRRYQPDVWRLCYQLVRNEHVAEDVTQDAFVRAFRFIRRYRAESRFSTWLFTIARNCAMDELRRSQRRAKLAGRIEGEAPPPGRIEQTNVEVREVLAHLPLDLREPIVLIDMFGLSYREVAAVMRMPEGTVKSRVHRGREQLARELDPTMEQENEG